MTNGLEQLERITDEVNNLAVNSNTKEALVKVSSLLLNENHKALVTKSDLEHRLSSLRSSIIEEVSKASKDYVTLKQLAAWSTVIAVLIGAVTLIVKN